MNALQTSATRTRVLIVDDHPVVRLGVRAMLEEQPDLEVCGEAGGFREALERIEELAPDVVVSDLALPDANGLELLNHLQRHGPAVPTIMLSMHDELIYAERALKAGARAYVMKQKGPGALCEAIRAARANRIHLSEAMTQRLLARASGVRDPAPAGTPLDVLTDRELGVFELIGTALPTAEIAQRLHISVKTVDTHKAHIKEKLGLSSGLELNRLAAVWTEGLPHDETDAEA